MTEERYRTGKLILLAIFVVGGLIIGRQFSENGHYVQYDHQKDFWVAGTSAQGGPTQVIDTRTGAVREAIKR